MGFITGVVVGAALSSGGGQHATEQSLVVLSDKNSTITCPAYKTQQICDTQDRVWDSPKGWPRRWIDVTLSPQEHIEKNGYKKILKIGEMFVGHTRYLIMEVSK